MVTVVQGMLEFETLCYKLLMMAGVGGRIILIRDESQVPVPGVHPNNFQRKRDIVKPTFEIQVLRQCRWETIGTELKRAQANKARRQACFFYPVVRIEQVPAPASRTGPLVPELSGA